MLSDLYASIQYLENQIQQLLSKNNTLSQDCTELEDAQGGIRSIISGQDRLMARQRSAWGNPVFGSSRSAQMLRERMESVVSAGAGRAARIGQTSSDVDRKHTEKKEEVTANQTKIQSLQTQIRHLYQQVQAEQARIAAQGGN